MKRRNADTGKLRRPIKRTKITEGMYGNSMLYLKFVIVWASVVLADYMLEFRFEFLWPFWILLRSVYDTYKYQGLAFSVFFICIALTSDMICFFFIPIQYIFFAASTYVWAQFVWYTFADKGICLHTVAICCFVVYVEGVRGGLAGGGGGHAWGARPLAAHCVGFPAVTLGVGVKKYVVRRLRARTQRLVKAQNEFYFELLREAVPPNEAVCECPTACPTRHMNGAAGGKKRAKPEPNGHCVTDKSEHIEAPTEKKATRERDKSTQNHSSSHPVGHSSEHSLSNGAAIGPGWHEEEDKSTHCKGNGKPSKYDKKEANTLKEERKEERRRNKKDKDKENSDSHKSTENTKEQTIKDKEVESTKECVRYKESSGSKDKEREREKERETRERDKERERDREREREREKELREARDSLDELKRIRAELTAARCSEVEAKKALAAAAAAEKLRKADYNQLKQSHAALQHKVSAWRAGAGAALERKLCEERRARQHAELALKQGRNNTVSAWRAGAGAALERKLCEERRARQHAELALKQGRNNTGECSSGACAARRAAAEAEAAALRRDVQRALDAAQQLQRDCNLANQQVRALEARLEAAATGASCSTGPGAEGGAWAALAARSAHLERALSAETRVKLDLLSALGEANRKMHIQDSVINQQEKELEELKAQMLAVMPTDFVTPGSTPDPMPRTPDGSVSNNLTHLRHSDGSVSNNVTHLRHSDGSVSSNMTHLRHTNGPVSNNATHRHSDGPVSNNINHLRQANGPVSNNVTHLRHSDGPVSNNITHQRQPNGPVSNKVSNARFCDGSGSNLRMSDGSVSNNLNLRMSDGSPLDPNASVYTPKQLCSDA